MTPEPDRMSREEKTNEERWVLGSSLHPDEQRYVLELFPESCRTLGMTDAQWLGQIEFLVKKDGSLDLRKRYCRLPAVPGEPDRRYHRSPRYEPLPTPPQRQKELPPLPPAEPEQREQPRPQPPLPPQLPTAEPRPSRPAQEQTYGQRVYQAYQALAEETKFMDVPIHALHRRVGGDIRDLHAFLRAECLAHRAVATTDEPTFAGDAARQSALTLPGEKEIFLNIKLLQPPIVQEQQQQPEQTAAQPEIGRRLTRDDLDVIIEALEYRCQAIAGGTDFDEVARLKSIVPTLEKLRALEAQPQRPEHERYERLLRATAALRYPSEERTPELEVRIEKTIARKVGEFVQERQAKAYEAGPRKELAQRHPNLTPDQAQRYERRINELVAQFRENQAQQQQQQQAQPLPARSQEQGRGIER